MNTIIIREEERDYSNIRQVEECKTRRELLAGGTKKKNKNFSILLILLSTSSTLTSFISFEKFYTA